MIKSDIVIKKKIGAAMTVVVLKPQDRFIVEEEEL